MNNLIIKKQGLEKSIKYLENDIAILKQKLTEVNKQLEKKNWKYGEVYRVTTLCDYYEFDAFICRFAENGFCFVNVQSGIRIDEETFESGENLSNVVAGHKLIAESLEEYFGKKNIC